MKKIIIAIALLVLPLAGFAAGQIVPSIKFYEFVAQIENSRGNIYLYETKLANSTTTCVVAIQNISMGTASNVSLDCK